jgi:hypothetical protein
MQNIGKILPCQFLANDFHAGPWREPLSFSKKIHSHYSD